MTMLDTSATRIARTPGRDWANRDWDGVQFHTLVLLCLPVHLMAAAAARLTPGFWARGRGRASLLVEAWRASGTTARIAFSG